MAPFESTESVQSGHPLNDLTAAAVKEQPKLLRQLSYRLAWMQNFVEHTIWH